MSTLRFLEEKVKKRLSSWHNRYLSQGGKEVLIKAVAMAIPTYTMSCYLFPKDMINRLNQDFARFWWKNNKTGRGIHWIAWEKLTKHKDDGGIGFRDLQGFNSALLCKQYWRLLIAPETLLARTLKARYFPTTSLLQAPLGHRPSYGWRSVHSVQLLMKLGVKTELGTGEDLDFWSDPWIIDAFPRAPRPISSHYTRDWDISDFKETVSDQWNIENLRSAVLEEDVEKILEIKPGGEGSRTGFSWIHTNTGEYSVKSGYKLWASSFQTSNLAPEQQPNFSQVYKRIWQTDTSSKLKHFLWRCSLSAISVSSEMKKKRLIRDDTCQVCGSGKEDVQHLMFKCPMATAMWSLSPYISIIADDSCSFNGQLFACIKLSESLPQEMQNLWPWIMWRIWKMRNDLVFQSKRPDIINGFHLAEADQAEWIKHSTSTVQPRAPLPHAITEILAWIPPQLGRYKCNVDATWKKDNTRSGIAWILRNNEGKVIFWGAKTFPRLRSPLEAEACALIWAVSCLRNMGYSAVDFETDSKSITEAMQNPKQWPRLLTYTSEFIAKCTSDSRSFQLTHVSRERNKAADSLARFAQEQFIYFGTIDNSVPLWLQPFLDANNVES